MGRVLVFVVVFVLAIHQIEATLRCYVCGGHSGRSCETIREPRRRSPYVRPEPVAASDGSPQWEQCNDLISNQGCIKQVVNNVVVLRACWMQATQECQVDGVGMVCTCTSDLCNAAPRIQSAPGEVFKLVVLCQATLAVFLLLRTNPNV
ncbi:hypothetical protein TCAL_14230 [Tigriopus californicus]|uniref:Protein sleepless n=1 Tax=Tigriopus californicus TaxID=6832 RepID=A0A553NUV7_TIGCA|nr:hypothetical protein TCAL_14230 [Tigriopus californicus]